MTSSARQLPSQNDKLIVAIDLPADPAFVFACWVQPSLLTQWWPPEATVEPYVGGSYHLAWTKIGQHLRGVYTTFEPARQLAFTWRWDHDEETAATRNVNVVFEASNGGTMLVLTHGSYTDSAADQELRLEHHLAGWNYFLPRLAHISRSYAVGSLPQPLPN